MNTAKPLAASSSLSHHLPYSDTDCGIPPECHAVMELYYELEAEVELKYDLHVETFSDGCMQTW
jgi:hypothetical protein